MLSLLFLMMVLPLSVGGSDPTLPFMEYLDQNHLVCVKWGFDNPQGNITFKLLINTTGWVGFGFSPNGGMAGADIVMGGLGSSGIYFKDYYATGDSMPLEDEQQSYTLLSANETDGQTIMTFQRTIQSCDDKDFSITTQAIKLIYAYGTTDQINYHASRRGTKEVNLLNYMPRATITGLNYLSARVNNISVPEKHTYYHCKVMKLSTLKTKHHITMVEPHIEHPDIVHHMLLYGCPSFVTQEYDTQCYKGDISDACFEVVASWAVGGGVYVLPETVGIPVGGETNERLYRLEIHYNNPNGDKGRTDSSGLKLYYTGKLRQEDVGTLTAGILHFDQMEYKIPPKVDQFHTYGVCNTSIFSQTLGHSPDLHVFGVLLHTHLAGRKIRVGHFRNGKLIGFLGLVENYNFEFQEVIPLGSVATIKQGDELVVECTYSTTTRTTATKMGLGTTDEMCLAFLLYYPAIKISSCISHPNSYHPLLQTMSSQIFEGTATPSRDDIAEYERLLKKVPQIQVVSSSENNHTFYENGIIREMGNSPTVACQTNPNNNNNNNSGSSRLGTSSIFIPAGIILLFLLVGIL
ncbi:DBH-like monooxygenase protein 2 homolog [Xyrichtys novacula]|uniref:DBH-like monooxygenase protein 2 homolog n=1 Tax=Xyrichtys novacula TaxID=13765 RepID=A0AAV1H1B2_XYRNO|nr:DBH-like monooxygenase protein 2 homolog [Xyrichtys novacula]